MFLSKDRHRTNETVGSLGGEKKNPQKRKSDICGITDQQRKSDYEMVLGQLVNRWEKMKLNCFSLHIQKYIPGRVNP